MAGKAPKNVFEVEQILEKRKRKSKIEYLVKWNGFSKKHNSWEPKANILDARLIKIFEEAQMQEKESSKTGSSKRKLRGRPNRPFKKQPRRSDRKSRPPKGSLAEDDDSALDMDLDFPDSPSSTAEDVLPNGAPVSQDLEPNLETSTSQVFDSRAENDESISVKLENAESPKRVDSEPKLASADQITENPATSKGEKPEEIVEKSSKMISKTPKSAEISSKMSKSAEISSKTPKSDDFLDNSTDSSSLAESAPTLQPMVSESELWLIQERNKLHSEQKIDHEKKENSAWDHSLVITDVKVNNFSVIFKESRTPDGFFSS